MRPQNPSTIISATRAKGLILFRSIGVGVWVFYFTAFSFIDCSNHRPLSPVSAEFLAAKIANEKCTKEFGEAPFKPEDFAAELNEGRWHWGTENGSPVDGYEIEVSFLPDGGDKQIVIRGRNRE